MKPWHITQVEEGLFSLCEIDMKRDGVIIWIGDLDHPRRHFILKDCKYKILTLEDRIEIAL